MVGEAPRGDGVQDTALCSSNLNGSALDPKALQINSRLAPELQAPALPRWLAIGLDSLPLTGKRGCRASENVRPSSTRRAAYRQSVIILVRVARVLLILVLALFTLSFVMGVGTPETGAIEKVVLVALIAGCIFLAAQVSTLATRVQERLQRR